MALDGLGKYFAVDSRGPIDRLLKRIYHGYSFVLRSMTVKCILVYIFYIQDERYKQKEVSASTRSLLSFSFFASKSKILIIRRKKRLRNVNATA